MENKDKQEILGVIQELTTTVNSGFNGVQGQINGLKEDVTGLKNDVNGLKGEFNDLKNDFEDLKDTVVNGFREAADQMDAFMIKTETVRQEQTVTTHQVINVKDRTEILEEKVDVLENDVKQIKPALGLS